MQNSALTKDGNQRAAKLARFDIESKQLALPSLPVTGYAQRRLSASMFPLLALAKKCLSREANAHSPQQPRLSSPLRAPADGARRRLRRWVVGE